MIKADSTSYYNVYLWFDKLVESEIYWTKVFEAISDLSKKPNALEWLHPNIIKMRPNVPNWVESKYGNLMNSITSLDKYNL